MTNKVQLYVVVWAVVISGCAVTPNPEAIGPYPDNYKDILKTYVLRNYFDPYSIRSASVSQPVQGHFFFQQGWIVCLELNAKNRMGGYIGLKRTAYLINRGVIIQTIEQPPLCDDPRLFFYSAWPELEQLK